MTALPPATSRPPLTTLSIVSHQQMHLVLPLLRDLNTVPGNSLFSVLLTLNLPEELPCSPPEFAYPL